ERAHEAALATFQAAGGAVYTGAETADDDADYDLVIDAVAGLGSSREVSAEVAALVERGDKVLAIDCPTGCGTQRSVLADATITFGHARTPLPTIPSAGRWWWQILGSRRPSTSMLPWAIPALSPAAPRMCGRSLYLTMSTT